MENTAPSNRPQTNIVAPDNIKHQIVVIVDQLQLWNIAKLFIDIVQVSMPGLTMTELDYIIALQIKPNLLLHSIVQHDK